MSEQKAPPAWLYYLNPWWRERHIYVTRLSPDECRRMLIETTTRLLGRRVARSWLSAADFTLHRVTLFNNSFKPYAYVRLRESMFVELTLSSSLYVRGFLVCWYGFLALLSILVATSGFQHPRGNPSDLATAAAFVLTLASFPLLLNAFGRALAAGDRAFLTVFLVEQLHLAPVSPAALPMG